MSLVYNMNRGRKNRELRWTDFTPYTQQMKHGHAAEMTPDVVADFQRMTQTLQNGTRHKRGT